MLWKDAISMPSYLLYADMRRLTRLAGRVDHAVHIELAAKRRIDGWAEVDWSTLEERAGDAEGCEGQSEEFCSHFGGGCGCAVEVCWRLTKI